MTTFKINSLPIICWRSTEILNARRFHGQIHNINCFHVDFSRVPPMWWWQINNFSKSIFNWAWKWGDLFYPEKTQYDHTLGWDSSIPFRHLSKDNDDAITTPHVNLHFHVNFVSKVLVGRFKEDWGEDLGSWTHVIFTLTKLELVLIYSWRLQPKDTALALLIFDQHCIYSLSCALVRLSVESLKP